jgi:hypothetical protein
MQTNSTGELVLSKVGNAMFSTSWTITHSLPTLTEVERDVIDRFGQKWFDGHALYVHHTVYKEAHDVMQQHSPLVYEVRGIKGRANSQREFQPRPHNPDYGDGKNWPAKETREMRELGLTFRPYRAWYRCQVRDEVRASFTIERHAITKLLEENQMYKNRVSEIDVLKLNIATLERRLTQIEQGQIDMAEAVDDQIGPFKLGQRGNRHLYTAIRGTN